MKSLVPNRIPWTVQRSEAVDLSDLLFVHLMMMMFMGMELVWTRIISDPWSLGDLELTFERVCGQFRDNLWTTTDLGSLGDDKTC